MGGSAVHDIHDNNGNPGKLTMAGRLRRETTLSIKAIAARVHLGTSKGANKQPAPVDACQLTTGLGARRAGNMNHNEPFYGPFSGQRLAEQPKGMAEKQVLAWWLRERTTAGRRWVSKRLGMGGESGVSKAIRLVKDMRDVELNRLKRRLLQAMKDGGEKENPARE